MKRSGSTIPQFVQRIPADVRHRAIGRTLTIGLGEGSKSETIAVKITERTAAVRFSLRARDPAEVKIRQAQAAAQLETAWQALRQAERQRQLKREGDAPLFLTNRDAHALAGDLYRAWAAAPTGIALDGEREGNLAATYDPLSRTWRIEKPRKLSPRETEAAFATAVRHLTEAIEREDDLEQALGPILDRLLLAKGIAEVDPECRPLLLDAFAMALRDAFESRRRNARGDFTPDPKAARFPEWSASVASRASMASRASAASLPSREGLSLLGLVEEWWHEAKAAGRKINTYEAYRKTIATFAAFLGHDDGSKVTPEDVIRFKEHRLTKVSAVTVKNGDLSGIKAIFGWAEVNRKLPANPAVGVTIRLGKPTRLRPKGFTDAEAMALLEAASTVKRGGERPETFAAKRWVPWLCAYTGARVGEMAQLRKQDIRQQGSHWIITITPEAGTVKTNEVREVVLHPHLVEQGFPEFAAGAPPGHLFLQSQVQRARATRAASRLPLSLPRVRPIAPPPLSPLGPLKGLKHRLQEFARETIKDKNVAPNHGWRHRFKTVGRDAGIDARILDAIQGHAPGSVGGHYGDVTLKAIAEAIIKLPRIETKGQADDTEDVRGRDRSRGAKTRR
jgi:integrase